MSQCFCGCGQEFGLTKRKQRKASEIGAETTRLLDEFNQYYRSWLESGRPGFETLPVAADAPSPEEFTTNMTNEGESIKSACLAVAHGMPDASMPIKADMKQWMFMAQQHVNVARMPLEWRQRVATALKSGGPQEIFDAFKQGEKETRP